MPYIPQVKVGNTIYQLKDRRVEDLKSALNTSGKATEYNTFFKGSFTNTASEDRCHSNGLLCWPGDEIVISGDFTEIKAAIGSDSGADSGWITQSEYSYFITETDVSSDGYATFYVNVAKTDGTSPIDPSEIDLTIIVYNGHSKAANMSIISEQNIENYYGNFLPLKDVTRRINKGGITFEQENGIITVNGTASSDVHFNLVYNTKFPASVYALSGCPDNGAYGKYGLIVYKKVQIGEYTQVIGNYSTAARNFTLDEDEEYTIDLVIWKNQTVSNLVFNPRLVQVGILSNRLLTELDKENKISDVLKHASVQQWEKNEFVQGSHYNIYQYLNDTVVDDSTRCTTKDYFSADVGDIVIVRNRSKSVSRFTLIGNSATIDVIFDSGWKIDDEVFTITHRGFYFINVSRLTDNDAITPSEVDITYTLIKSYESSNCKAGAIQKTAYEMDDLHDIGKDKIIDHIEIDLPVSDTVYDSVTIEKKSKNYAQGITFEIGNIDEHGENIGGSDRYRSATFLEIEPCETFILNYTEYVRNGLFFYDENRAFIHYRMWDTKNRTFITPENAKYYRIAIEGQVEPTNVTVYKKSDNTSMTIDLSELAEEPIYGGKIIVRNDGTGIIRREWNKYLGSELEWVKNSLFDHTFNANIPELAAYLGYDKENGGFVTLNGYTTESSRYVGYIDHGIATGDEGNVVYVTNFNYTNISDFRLYIANMSILYPLKEKQEYAFLDDTIRELFNYSTGIYSSSKGILKTVYISDTKAYIDELDIQTKKYYREEIAKTIDEVKALQTEPCLVFPLLTDIHYGDKQSKLPFLFDETWKNMMAVSKEIRFDAVVCLGDLMEGDFSEEVAIQYGSHVSNLLRKFAVPYLLAIGNHDDNRYDTQLSEQDMYKAYFAYTYNRAVRNADSYGDDYYVDFPEYKIRFICLDSVADGMYKFSAETAEWFATEALSTPNGYTAVLLTHVSPINSHNYEEMGAINSTLIQQAIDDYTKNGKTVIELYGHSHYDAAFTSPYLSVGTNCSKFEIINGSYTSWPEGATKPYRSENHYTEDCWDVVVIRPGSRKINFVRFGAGNNREYTY